MAKNSHTERKEQLISSLKQKRVAISQSTNHLQASVARPVKGRQIQAIPAIEVAQQEENQVKSASGLASFPALQQLIDLATDKFPALGSLEKTVKLRNALAQKLPSKKVVKPVLLGLGASFIVISLLKAKKKNKVKVKKEEADILQRATKPAAALLILKTLLTISQPALKHVVTSEVKKRVGK